MNDVDPAVEKVIAGIGDDALAARYPDRAHFIAAGNPHQGEIATQALFAGDPVVIVYPDGRELLVRPEQVGGIAAVLLILVAFVFKHRRRKSADVIQLPPRVPDRGQGRKRASDRRVRRASSQIAVEGPGRRVRANMSGPA